MQITILSVGKIKEPFVLDGIKQYQKYLRTFANMSFEHVNPAHIPKNPSEGDIKQVRIKEASLLRKKLKPAYKVALTPEGKMLSSEKFARLLKDIGIYKDSKITVLIGGSYGLDESIKRECDSCISLSKLTFPHQLTALIVTEQIFRAFKINNKEPYHK